MGINFPNNPSQGALYTPPGGYQYVYLDGVWRVVEAPQNVGTAQARSRIVNGAMQISQEWGNASSGFATTMSIHNADQWLSTTSHSPGTLSSQRVQLSTPNGSKDRLRLTVGTAKAVLGAGDFVQLRQHIEGIRTADFMWGTASAKQVVARFGFKGPAGTYAFNMMNGAANRSYVAMFTISAAQANTDTVQTFVVPGDTIGTWPTDSAQSAYFRLIVACGTSFQNAAGWTASDAMATSAIGNGMATAGAVYELFDVGLYLDPLATGVAPRWEMPDEAQELAACMRYFYNGTPPLRGVAAGTVNAVGRLGTRHPVPMRVIPALAITNAPALYDGTSTLGLTGVVSNYSSATVLELDGTVAGTYGARAPIVVFQTVGSGNINVSARM